MNTYRVGWKKIFSINKILLILVISDIFMFSGFGLMSPIFAVFVNEQIISGSLIVVGISESIYLGVKSIFQLPIGILIDRISGEKIDFYLALTGNLLFTLAAFLYIFARIPTHIYLIQALMGIAGAVSYPAWMGLFSRNMDQGKESFIWSIHSTFTELFSAVTAVLGGVIAASFGFKSLFISVAIMGFIGSIFLIFIYSKIKKA